MPFDGQVAIPNTIAAANPELHAKALAMAGDKLGGSAPVIAGDPVAVREKLMELVELGFDYSIATFPQFQELDDMKLFVDQVLPHFS